MRTASLLQGSGSIVFAYPVFGVLRTLHPGLFCAALSALFLRTLAMLRRAFGAFRAACAHAFSANNTLV